MSKVTSLRRKIVVDLRIPEESEMEGSTIYVGLRKDEFQMIKARAVSKENFSYEDRQSRLVQTIILTNYLYTTEDGIPVYNSAGDFICMLASKNRGETKYSPEAEEMLDRERFPF